MTQKINKYLLLASITAIAISCSNERKLVIDVTNYKCITESNSENSPIGEDISKLTDNDIYSKFLTFSHSSTIEFQILKKCKLSHYSIVSGGDEESRDPKTWTLEASNDRTSWTLLDKQHNVTFTERNQVLGFSISNSDNYQFYRLNLSTKANDILQLSEVELWGNWDSTDKNPIALFSSDKQSFFNKGEVSFTNLSEKADSHQWYFEGGSPETSQEANPLVTYKSHGKYDVQLIAQNNELSDTIKLNDFIVVKREGAWNQFQYPKTNFINKTLGGNGDFYKELIPEPIDLINKVCLDVCKILYRSVDEINTLDILDYSIEDMETISAKGGNPPHINIFFSSSYLMNKKGSMSKDELISEIVGVLYHELTHGYQYSPKGAGGYQQGTDFFGFLEGTADYVRYKAGYSNLNYRKPGGHWNDGYKTTAFFIDWLHNKDADFVYKLNQTTLTIIPWSWEKATQEILTSSVSDLWDDYQAFLESNSQANSKQKV
ncbi:hypothetical protein DWB61_15305 [Ancylomarina euxinus]|uniref:PKD domain-containing protein n=1 Tax=Ancylomarina euxinus TaxID=2283627 RepID=A0A425XXK3_9BACT|nr:basic secretory protein-like protein [Ancylomarina euxinus]MCZ4694718.1 basic secretory protein-like protein [Ancylomarina euxinus]MUP16382.1 hypothetical protein [Ancylomarina euxinus]RRG19413.1 hypothetical protein DWB61_15305 [Ancylomarina euxinus]